MNSPVSSSKEEPEPVPPSESSPDPLSLTHILDPIGPSNEATQSEVSGFVEQNLLDLLQEDTKEEGNSVDEREKSPKMNPPKIKPSPNASKMSNRSRNKSNISKSKSKRGRSSSKEHFQLKNTFKSLNSKMLGSSFLNVEKNRINDDISQFSKSPNDHIKNSSKKNREIYGEYLKPVSVSSLHVPSGSKEALEDSADQSGNPSTHKNSPKNSLTKGVPLSRFNNEKPRKPSFMNQLNFAHVQAQASSTKNIEEVGSKNFILGGKSFSPPAKRNSSHLDRGSKVPIRLLKVPLANPSPSSSQKNSSPPAEASHSQNPSFSESAKKSVVDTTPTNGSVSVQKRRDCKSSSKGIKARRRGSTSKNPQLQETSARPSMLAVFQK